MSEDKHLGTGEYEPRKYWNARAKASSGDTFSAVCVFGAPSAQNAAAERVQHSLLSSLLSPGRLNGARVLEVGCGVGRLAPWFIARGAHYTGCDISCNMLDMARSRGLQAEFHLIEPGVLDFPDAGFDLVCSVTVLHHNPYVDQERLLAEMSRTAKPGGMVLIMESIEPRRSEDSFNIFPRPISDWQRVAFEHGGLLPAGVRYARWWLLRDAVFRVLRVFIPRIRLDGALNDILIRLGGIIDPWLNRLLPARYATNAAMLFRKP